MLQILDKEAVEEVRVKREIPDIRPGYIIQLKVVIVLHIEIYVSSSSCHCHRL